MITVTKHVERGYFKNNNRFKGLAAWVFSTDHKRIGILYLYSIVLFFVIGALLGLLMKFELLAPGKTIIEAKAYNGVFTLHGIIMLFLIVVPGIPAVFGNFFLPLLIGAKNVAFPKLNLVSWWVYILGALVAISSQLLTDVLPESGQAFYAPYSFRVASNMLPVVLGVFILGLSSILTGVNFIVTVHRMRAPGITWMKMPLFPWSLYGAAWIQIIATPILGVTLLMITVQHTFNIGFFNLALGGDPVLYKQLFWVYLHPAIYIMILPAMGIVSEILPTFARKPIYSYKTMVIATMLIAFNGYIAWGYHIVTVGMRGASHFGFSFLIFLVAIPIAIKMFNWIATLYKGSIQLKTPFYWAASFLFVFMIGACSALVLATVATNVYVHDTAFVVAHFHFIIFGGVGYAFMAAIHYWFPKIFGRMYDEGWADIGWAVFFTGFLSSYFPMFFLGIKGMPRMYYNYADEFHGLNMLSSFGTFIMIFGLAIIIINLVRSSRNGVKGEQNPWGGVTLEWSIPSPPPPENFKDIPQVSGEPYDFSNVQSNK